ncbi:MAG TPA: endonuclease III [Candidatus Paceibacterota bacterium]|nr:endonuclease III [Candidatus Paceibacterota bacterium]
MTPKKLEERKLRIQKLNKALSKLYPHAKIELNYKTPWELLVAVQLSAQSTDKQVNKITEKLFKKYKKLEDYVRAGKSEKGRREFEKDIFASGFYRNKAKSILALAKIIKEDLHGRIPKDITILVTLPGIGRKTANVVLAEAFGVLAGVTVDTHVIRFVKRFDLSSEKTPEKIEKDLMQLLPKREWRTFTHRVIWYGRRMAPARIYDTSKDPLVKIYPPAAKLFRV